MVNDAELRLLCVKDIDPECVGRVPVWTVVRTALVDLEAVNEGEQSCALDAMLFFDHLRNIVV